MDQGINNLNLERKKELMLVEIAQTDVQYVWFDCVLCLSFFPRYFFRVLLTTSYQCQHQVNLHQSSR